MVILESTARGLTNKDIAVMLGISADAVKQHLQAICAKLGAANRAEAVAIALKKHLLKA
jgi:DNA-binding CsgD family transcriptional regulator